MAVISSRNGPETQCYKTWKGHLGAITNSCHHHHQAPGFKDSAQPSFNLFHSTVTPVSVKSDLTLVIAK